MMDRRFSNSLSASNLGRENALPCTQRRMTMTWNDFVIMSALYSGVAAKLASKRAIQPAISQPS